VVGRTISHYRILRKLGSGGMGVVYEAEDINLKRRVAAKFLPEDLYKDEKALERFEREARAASLLNHPNICAIHEIEEDEGKPFLIMELLEGEDLRQKIRGEPMNMDEILDVGVQIADALDAAHAEGIIHRDIKPANIFLTRRGTARLLDFGLAKMTGQELTSTLSAAAAGGNGGNGVAVQEHLTTADVIPGTAVYMSPEQARGEELDSRSDIFSFGTVLYEMSTGRKPFLGKNVLFTLDAILTAKPISPSKWNPRLPPDFESVVGKALEKKRDNRYQSARALRDDLKRLKRESEATLSDVGGKPVSLPRSRTFGRWSRQQTYMALAGAAIFGLVLFAGLLVMSRRNHPAAATAATVAPHNSIAVLALENLDGDKGADALRVSLTDSIAAALTRSGSLDVRPAPLAARSAGASDAARAGRELGVHTILTGHYLRQGSEVQVTLQAVDVANNRLLWQSSVTAAPGNPLDEKIAAAIRQELLPILEKAAARQP